MMRTVEGLLGTRVEFAVASTDAAAAHQIEVALLDEIRRLEKIFTVFDPDSALQRHARTGEVAVAELAAVLELAERWWERTDGIFHPGMQRLMTVWDEAERTQVEPDSGHLARMIADLGVNPVGGADNLNAIAKGWIVDRSVDRAMAAVAEGVVDQIWLNVGGDIVHRGVGSVRVGVEDPHRPYDNAAPLATVELAEAALATSGGTRRWWTIGGVRHPKVLDPRTGRPVGGRVRSATVIADDAATADVLATVALIATVDETRELVLEAHADCLLVLDDRQVVATSDRFTTR